MLYNIDQSLWENYRKAYPATRLLVNDGHVFRVKKDKAEDCLARFASTDAATETLKAAGYRQTGFGLAPVFTGN